MGFVRVRTRWRIIAGIAVLAMVGLIAMVGRTQGGPMLRRVELDQSAGDLAVDTSAGQVFVETWRPDGGDARLHVFDARTGTLLRAVAVPDQGNAFGISERNGHIFTARTATNGATTVRMLDARRGAVLPTIPIDTNPSMVVVRERTGRVYVVSGGVGLCDQRNTCSVLDSSVSVLDAASGRLLRRLRVTGGANAIGVDDRAERVVVTSGTQSGRSSGTVSVLDARTGRLVRAISIPMGPGRVVVDEVTGRAFVLASSSNPFLPNSNTGRVYVLDTRTGAVVRTLMLPSPPVDVAVDEAAGHAFVAVKGPSRLVSFTFPPVGGGSGRVTSSGGGGAERIPSGQGEVRMLDTRGGAVLRTVLVGVAPTALAVDARRGLILVAAWGSKDSYVTSGTARVTVKAPLVAPGSVSVLDATTGAVRRTITLDTSPRAITVDERTGHVFVVNDGSFVPLPIPDPWAWIPGWARRWAPFVPSPPSGTRTVSGSMSVLDIVR